eukprot:1134703-Heterocapsa_arctica.AAC.1
MFLDGVPDGFALVDPVEVLDPGRLALQRFYIVSQVPVDSVPQVPFLGRKLWGLQAIRAGLPWT